MKQQHEVQALALAGIVAVSAALALAGCGSSEKRSARHTEPGSTTAADYAVQAGAVPEAQAVPAEKAVETSDRGLPPDLSVTLADTTAAPGESVDIVAHGTHDVIEMLVKDDRGEPMALTYDADLNLWRGSYRVPLKNSSERIGLSVTARNEMNRWRRVWLFVRVGEKAPEAETVTQEDPNEQK